jgi:hypothetical protein
MAAVGTASISSATEAGNTVTITTSAPHGFQVGQSVTISGVGVAGYNGTFTVVSVTGTTFTYTDPTGSLGNSSGGTAAGGAVPTVTYSSPDGGFTWIVTFSGAGVHGGSIADGAYTILLNSSAVTFGASGATLTQSNRGTDTFYRLFGDNRGTQSVNTNDSRDFSRAFGHVNTDAAYVAAFDFDGDLLTALTDTITTTDSRQFARRFGVVYSGFTTTM